MLTGASLHHETEAPPPKRLDAVVGSPSNGGESNNRGSYPKALLKWALVGIIVTLWNHIGAVHAAPSSADIGVVHIAVPIKVFDSGDHPERSGSGQNGIDVTLRQRAALDCRMIGVCSAGKERFGGFPHSRKGRNLSLIENEVPVCDPHLKSRTTSSVFYSTGASTALFNNYLAPINSNGSNNSNWSNPRSLIFNSGVPEFHSGNYQPSGHKKQKPSENSEPNVRYFELTIITLRPLLFLMLGVGITIFGYLLQPPDVSVFNITNHGVQFVAGLGWVSLGWDPWYF
jgi:hypothetical protein